MTKGDRVGKFVSVVDGAGKKASFKDHKNDLVVLTFGASWCKPCSKELPAYEKLAAKYAGKVTFLAVNIDSDIKKGKAFMAKAKLKHVQALYDTKKSTVESFEPSTMPTTYVIKKGLVKHVHAGFRDGDVGKLEKVLLGEMK